MSRVVPKCKKHPRYKAKRQPRYITGKGYCVACWRYWMSKRRIGRAER